MGTPPTIEVTPIYGWGWVIVGEGPFEVPAPFTMSLEYEGPKGFQGIVLDDGHEFYGQRATLSQRHVEWDGCVNIDIEPLDRIATAVAGYGMVTRLPSTTRR
jgi:hypothetical protein